MIARLGAFGFYLDVTKQAGFRSPWLFSTAAISSEGDIAAVLVYEAKLWMKKKINNLIQW